MSPDRASLVARQGTRCRKVGCHRSDEIRRQRCSEITHHIAGLQFPAGSSARKSRPNARSLRPQSASDPRPRDTLNVRAFLGADTESGIGVNAGLQDPPTHGLPTHLPATAHLLTQAVSDAYSPRVPGHHPQAPLPDRGKGPLRNAAIHLDSKMAGNKPGAVQNGSSQTLNLATGIAQIHQPTSFCRTTSITLSTSSSDNP